MIKQIKFCFLFLFAAMASTMLAQTNTAAPAPVKEEDEFAKKKVETKLQEVIPTDSVGAGDLSKRAVAWIKADSEKYKKTNAASSDSKVECVAAFPVKPKELNPQVDFTGKITMKVVVECKSSKYRYTISDIKHTSKNGKSNGGSVDNVVPECGSMGMTDIIWKKLKGEMMRDAAQVAADLKIAMGVIAQDAKPEEW
jgi:hypothetical protein